MKNIVTASSPELIGEDFVVFDIETTGLYFEVFDEPIEIAAIKINSEMKIVDTFHVYILPQKNISKEIEELTGLNEEIIKKHGPISRKNAITGFNEFIKGSVLVAHNAIFDVTFMNYFFNYYKLPLITKYICTMQSFRALNTGTKVNLEAMCDYFGEVNGQAHTAIEDVKATAKCFIKMLNENMPIAFNKLTKIEAYELFKKRIFKSSPFSKIKFELTSVYSSEIKTIGISEIKKNTIKEMLSEGISFEDITSKTSVRLGFVKGLFLEWVNPINKVLYPNILGNNPETAKNVKEILAVCDWDVKEACNLVLRLSGLPADQLKFLYVKKMYNKFTKYEYHDGELDTYFESMRDYKEVCNLLNITTSEFVFFLVKWLSRHKEMIDIWSKLISDILLSKEEYVRMQKCKNETPDEYEKKYNLLSKKQIERIKNTEMMIRNNFLSYN